MSVAARGFEPEVKSGNVTFSPPIAIVETASPPRDNPPALPRPVVLKIGGGTLPRGFVGVNGPHLGGGVTRGIESPRFALVSLLAVPEARPVACALTMPGSKSRMSTRQCALCRAECFGNERPIIETDEGRLDSIRAQGELRSTRARVLSLFIVTIQSTVWSSGA